MGHRCDQSQEEIEAASREASMSCRSCTSENLKEFGSEINIHFPGRQGLDKAAVLIFPRVIVCVDCRFTEFTFSEAELYLLRERDAA